MKGVAFLHIPPMVILSKWQAIIRRVNQMQSFVTETRKSIEERPCNLTYTEVKTWGENFQSLMKNPRGRETFKEYLTQEHAEENILFWEAVEAYKVIETDQRRRLALDIYDQFVNATKSDTEISIDSKTRRQLESAIVNIAADPTACNDTPSDRTKSKNEIAVDPSIFQDAQTHIYDLMEKDSWRRFALSQLYKAAVIARLPQTTLELWEQSFEALLQDSFGRKLFLEFLQREHADENLLFWQEVENFRKLQSEEERKRVAGSIWRRYLDKQSDSEINMDHQSRMSTQQRLADARHDTFTLAQSHVYTLMARDCYPRFTVSKLFRNLKDEHARLAQEVTTNDSSTINNTN